MKKYNKKQLEQIGKKAAKTILYQFQEDEYTKTELKEMIKDAEEDFIEGGYENFMDTNYETNRDVNKLLKIAAKFQTKYLKLWLL